MSDLEEMGFLEQPHTSAGRVPSEKAYRFYVNTMMKAGALSEDEIAFMRSYFNTRMTEAEEVVARTARLLSDLTDYTSMVMSPELNTVIVKHVQLVPVTPGRALAVIVTDAGLVRDSFIAVPSACTATDLERLSNMVTSRVKNMPLNEAVEALNRGAGEEMEEQRSCFTSIADAIAHDISREASRGVILGGATNLLKHPEYLDFDKASSMLAVLETKEQLYRILSKAAKMEFTVTIGSENELPEMQSSSVVTATYKISGKPVGSFGVIGPIRMDYAKVVTVLNQMGKTLSTVLTGMLSPEDKQ
jgi:heat-inducible transcriptional repressor